MKWIDVFNDGWSKFELRMYDPRLAGVNAYGAAIFAGTDGGVYQFVPKVEGVQFQMLVNDNWQVLFDEGLDRQQYARDLLKFHEMMTAFNVTVIGMGIGGSGAFTPTAAVQRAEMAAANATKVVAQRAAKIAAEKAVYRLNAHKQLTNGKYTVSKEAMVKHIVGGVSGKSIFYPTINAEEAVLQAAQYADDFGLWVGNKAKVPVMNTNIGTLSNGQPTHIINVYKIQGDLYMGLQAQ